jgi:hypothetical protein
MVLPSSDLSFSGEDLGTEFGPFHMPFWYPVKIGLALSSANPRDT